MSETYEIGSHTFEFTYRTHGWRGYVAANVKCHAYPSVPKHLKEKYAQMLEEDPELERNLESQAWDDAQEDWWDWAREYASEMGFDEKLVYSSGRSGGWLELHQYTRDDVEGLVETAQSECLNCERPLYEHAANGKCLFGPTTFESGERPSIERLEALEQFLQTCEKSARNSGSAIQEHFEERLADTWESLFGEATPMLTSGG